MICYDGDLKSSVFSRMQEAVNSCDLVLVLGTSLSGLRADKAALAPAKRSLQGRSLGTVIVNLQQTPQDGVATLRLFADTDTVFEMVLGQLTQGLALCPRISPPAEHKALVPYTSQGCRRPEGPRMWLDLTKGARLRLAPDHNCQGAKQPVYEHIGASAPHVYRGKLRQPGPGEGHVVRYGLLTVSC